MKLETLRKLTRSALLVYHALKEHGTTPIGKLSEWCALSARSVQRALAELKAVGFVVTQMAHDHVFHGSNLKGTASPLAPSADPLVTALTEAGIWEGPAARLVATHGAERITRQLAHHAQRLAAGFKFKASPAAYLYQAIVHDYAAPWSPPPGLQEAQQARRKEAPVQVDPPREDKARIVAWHLTRKDPQQQAEGRRLAEAWGIVLYA